MLQVASSGDWLACDLMLYAMMTLVPVIFNQNSPQDMSLCNQHE